MQVQRLEDISSSEQIQYNQDALESVVDISKGDLRKALNLLQMAGSTKDKNSNVSKEDVLFISDVLPSSDVFSDYIDPYLKICTSSKKK